LLNVLYLVPNLADSAVRRRVDMLRQGGADVEAAGFRRADVATPDLGIETVVELDTTFDARFAQRIMATAKAYGAVPRWAQRLKRPDVIVARNLEMLSLAARLQDFWSGQPALAYECLDIHRLMLRADAVGRAMRGAERHWAQRAGLLLTSSPAFLRNYFDIYGGPPALLVENKVFGELGVPGRNPALTADEGSVGPIRIGWFGALRCRKSLAALAGLAEAMDGQVEVLLRGRPARTEFDDFDGQVAAAPHLRFEGAYRNPDDLGAIYSDVHLAWAIDFFEEGQNSRWLLPNRIYEGCRNGAIPVALAGTETAAFIERLGIGIVLPDIAPRTLRTMLAELTPQRVRKLAEAVAKVSPTQFVCTQAECRELVNRLASLDPARQPVLEAA